MSNFVGRGIGVKNLAKQLGINLTKRKALQTIPAFGAIVEASVKGWYIKEVGWAARRAFQERWLLENIKSSKSKCVLQTTDSNFNGGIPR